MRSVYVTVLVVSLPTVASASTSGAGFSFGVSDASLYAHDSSLRVDVSVGALRFHSLQRSGVAFGFALMLTLPLDRLALPWRTSKELALSHRKVSPWAAMAVVPAFAVGPALAKETRVVPAPSASGPHPSASPAPTPSASIVPSLPPAKGLALDGDKIRALVLAAQKLAGLDRDDVFDAIATRARASALLPELRLRVFRTADAGLTLYDSGDASEATRSTALGGTRTGIEARFSFRLDRLVFADEEIALERLRLERLELKQKIATRIIELVVRWAKAERASRDTLLLDVERDAAAATALECLAALDAFTGGLATKLLLGKAPRVETPPSLD